MIRTTCKTLIRVCRPRLEPVAPLIHPPRIENLNNCYHCGSVHRSKSSDQVRKKRRQLRDEEAQEAMDNLNKDMREKYKKIRMELQILGASNFKAPDPERISANEWMYMLHGIDSEKDRKRYLLTLGLRQRAKEKVKEVLPDYVVEEGVYNTKSRTRKEDFRKARAVQGMILGNPIVLDLDYEMTESEERKILTSFLQCYSAHTQHGQPFRLIVTGVRNKPLFKRELEIGGSLEFVIAEFHEESFSDIFQKQQLVYLSPDARYCSEYNGDSVYVIGGLSTRQENKLMSASKAKMLGIPAVGLPIRKHLKMMSNGGHDLAMDTVYRVMLDVNLHHSWRQALLHNLPPAKYSPLKERRKLYYEAGDDIVITDQNAHYG